MSYLVLARKWRPQQFDEIVGQPHVVTTLKNAISMDRVAHAYLFSGPRGIGKTSTARIFAKALNCKKGPIENPCDECTSCSEISLGTSLDILEIDGASNRGIDQVRELRENAKFAPASCRFKIYIIDEVHMLTQEAFNALLKTLEEPPGHVKFFFATTEPFRVPATILSRCQRFDLRKISTREIFSRLKDIAKKEKVHSEDKILFAIAKRADGSLRDAQSLLDQLISFSQGDLKYEEALNILGWVPREEVLTFVQSLKEGDWKRLFSLIRQIDVQGQDATIFTGELASHLRDLLLLKVSPDEVDLIELVPEDLEKAKAQAQLFTRDELLQMLEVTLEVEDHLKFAVSRRSMLEALAVRLYLMGQSVTLEHLMQKVESLAPSAQVEDVKKNGSPLPEAKTPTLKVEQDPWEKVLEGMATRKPLVFAYLKEAVPYWEGQRFRLLFPQEKIFCLEALQSEDHQRIVKDEVRNAFGLEASLELGLLPAENSQASSAAQGKAVSETGLVASPVKGKPTSTTAVSPSSATGSGLTLLDDPVVQKALEIFQGRITEIKRS